MNIGQLRPGIYPVRITDSIGTVEFNLSVVSGVGGLRGFAGFQHGQKAPKRGAHRLLDSAIFNWVEQMQLRNEALSNQHQEHAGQRPALPGEALPRL